MTAATSTAAAGGRRPGRAAVFCDGRQVLLSAGPLTSMTPSAALELADQLRAAAQDVSPRPAGAGEPDPRPVRPEDARALAVALNRFATTLEAQR